MGRLEGKIAVVTGANSGIGLASAKRFAQEGARLFVTGRQAELDAAVKEIGGDTVGVRGDVSILADLDRLYETVRERSGVLFANAGGGEFAALQDVTEEHFDRTFATWGRWAGKAAIPHSYFQKSGYADVDQRR
jgi:NAD(P)-dependent dehydrogenase (short-subunit alcohol dehydrogenase family)